MDGLPLMGRGLKEEETQRSEPAVELPQSAANMGSRCCTAMQPVLPELLAGSFPESHHNCQTEPCSGCSFPHITWLGRHL